jgi:hypothetical protein
MIAPQKNNAARGWKFGNASGNALPMQRKTITSEVNNAMGRKRFMRETSQQAASGARRNFRISYFPKPNFKKPQNVAYSKETPTSCDADERFLEIS